ncbi:hypothetical protein PV326_001741, partial [Microctonus aethiopoides]
PGSKLVRWRLKLLEYEYEIVYKPGKLNSNTDALSRPYTEINIIQKDEPFHNFIQYHYKTIDIPKIETTPLEENKCVPNVLFHSIDLDEYNYLSQFRDTYDMSNVKE